MKQLREGIFIETDSGEITILKSDIRAECDIDYLQELLVDVRDAGDCLDIVRKTMNVDPAEDTGMSYKLSLYRIAQNWIEKRIKELGSVPNGGTEKEARQAEEITRLRAQNAALKSQVLALQAKPEDAHAAA